MAATSLSIEIHKKGIVRDGGVQDLHRRQMLAALCNIGLEARKLCYSHKLATKHALGITSCRKSRIRAEVQCCS